MPEGQRQRRRGQRGSGKKLLDDHRLRLLFELARSVFHCSVGEMLQRVSQHELNYWLVLETMDPSGERRADLRHAIGVSAFVNTQVQKKRDLTKPKDFLTGELLAKQHRKSAARRGLVHEWDAKAFWRKLTKPR